MEKKKALIAVTLYSDSEIDLDWIIHAIDKAIFNLDDSGVTAWEVVGEEYDIVEAMVKEEDGE
jgi:uncharacterized protein YbbC (DUF1343 family)